MPQGPVLSPLFIIFVNTIEKGIDSEVLKFADDVKVLRTVETGQDQDAFQSNLDKRFKWSEDKQMKFNLKSVRLCTQGECLVNVHMKQLAKFCNRKRWKRI